MTPEISLVIPAMNEAEALGPLVEEALVALGTLNRPFEIILVDDASTDSTPEVIAALDAAHPQVRGFFNPVNAGQSASVHNGVLAAEGRWICTVDGDGQNPPDQLPKLLAPLLAEDAPEALALVAGQRVDRQDTVSKRWASRFANGLRGWILKDGTRDTGCGLKAYRRDAFLALPYFDHMHRYLPALMKNAGHEVALVDVSDRLRETGQSKYNNLQRALVGIVDLIGVSWIMRRAKRSTARPIGERK